MKIDTLKQRVMKACLLVTLIGISTAVHAAPSFDEVDRDVRTELAAKGHKELLAAYNAQQKHIKDFFRQFLNENVDGRPQVFLVYLKNQLKTFEKTVVRPVQQLGLACSPKLSAMFREFQGFENVMNTAVQRNIKSAWGLAPLGLTNYLHLVPNEFLAYKSRITQIISYRLNATGNNIGIA